MALAISLMAGIMVHAAADQNAFETPGQWIAMDGNFTRTTVSKGDETGETCLELSYDPAAGPGLIAQMGIPGEKDWQILSLRLKSPGAGSIKLQFKPKDYSFSFEYNIKTTDVGDQWVHLNIKRKDFSTSAPEGVTAAWDKVAFCYFVFSADEKMTARFDAIRLHKPGAFAGTRPAGDLVVVNNCEDTAGWHVDGTLQVSAKPEYRQQGNACLALTYSGGASGSISAPVPNINLTDNHALIFKIRGASPTTKAKCWLKLTCANGASFRKELSIANFEWYELILFRWNMPYWMKAIGIDGKPPTWQTIRSVGFVIENNDAAEQGNIMLDAVAFNRIAGAGNPQSGGKFFWWNGKGFDPFMSMHVKDADWPHAQDNKYKAPLKFSSFLLTPLVPYTVYLHNDKPYARQQLTITDWEMNVVKVVERTNTTVGVTPINLQAPPTVGTYLFNLENFTAGKAEPKRYQTGITVLAKRLSEPKGIWRLHGQIMATDRMDHYLDVVGEMFEAVGVTGIRIGIGMPNGNFDRMFEKYAKGANTRQANFFREMKARNVSVLGSIHVNDHKDIFMSIVRNKFAPPESIPPFMKDIEMIARCMKGQVDWLELGNEYNEHDLGPYAEILKKSYVAAKKGDPNCRFTMNGCHTIDQWQKGLWEMEKAETDPRYKTYQDTLATHLYPDLQGVEPTLREWLDETIGVEALKAKGQIMTEAGWPVFQIFLQDMLKAGLLPPDYDAELDFQSFMAMYGPVLLGEHLKIGAPLYGVYYFMARQVTTDAFFLDKQGRIIPGCLRVGGCGHWANRYNDEMITVARRAVYTHNTLARLLTHEVQYADIPVTWDKDKGNVEYYAFRRPGETVLAIWIGPPAKWQRQPRAESLVVSIDVPKAAGLVIETDIVGNESRVVPQNGKLTLELTRPKDVKDANGRILYLRAGRPVFLRFITGERRDTVFMQNLDKLPRQGFRVLKGIPEMSAELVTGIGRDRNLPAVNDRLPAPGEPLVLYSKIDNCVYITGRTQADIELAERAFAKHQSGRF